MRSMAACALLLELREDGSPACLVHSIPAWNDGLREDEQPVGMGQRDLLDRTLLEFQTGVNFVVGCCSAEVGIDGKNMRVGNGAMESSMGCDGCCNENGKCHGRTKAPVRRYQYDGQP